MLAPTVPKWALSASQLATQVYPAFTDMVYTAVHLLWWLVTPQE